MAPLDEPPARKTRPAFLPGREPMSVMDAIYSRRAVRDFTPEDLPETALHALLYAAVQAPSVVAGDLWGFSVIQDRAMLKALSDDTAGNGFNIFFNAGTLVTIYGDGAQAFAPAGCWLAAENLILAACGMGIGACIIGMAVEALNAPGWKARLEIPSGMTAVAPIILGMPAGANTPVHRPAPNILSWTRG